MHKGLALALAVSMALISLAGCDDDSSATKIVRAAKHGAASNGARLGAGWRNTADARTSAWGFANGADSLDAIRAALDSGMLPAKPSVKIAALVNRFATGLPQPEAGAAPFRPTIVLTTPPWSDDTLLLWVGVAGAETLAAPTPQNPAPVHAAIQAQPLDHPAITIEFDAKTVVAYRPLGDPSALPAEGPLRSAAVLYELSPLDETNPGGTVRYATLRIRYRLPGAADAAPQEIVRPITAGDFVEAVDDAPGMVRFAAAVAGFGSLLKGDPAVRDLSCDEVIALAESAVEPDPDGARGNLIRLMRRAEPLIDLPSSDPPIAGDPAR